MNEQPKRNSYLFFCRAFVLVTKIVDSRASKGSNLSKLMWSRLQERSINCLNFRIIILFSNLVPFKVLYSTRTLCRVSIYAFCMHSKVKRTFHISRISSNSRKLDFIKLSTMYPLQFCKIYWKHPQLNDTMKLQTGFNKLSAFHSKAVAKVI